VGQVGKPAADWQIGLFCWAARSLRLATPVSAARDAPEGTAPAHVSARPAHLHDASNIQGSKRSQSHFRTLSSRNPLIPKHLVGRPILACQSWLANPGCSRSIVGQVGNLRPIGNRPLAQRIFNRLQEALDRATGYRPSQAAASTRTFASPVAASGPRSPFRTTLPVPDPQPQPPPTSPPSSPRPFPPRRYASRNLEAPGDPRPRRGPQHSGLTGADILVAGRTPSPC
jgi:hypothetical protein